MSVYARLRAARVWRAKGSGGGGGRVRITHASVGSCRRSAPWPSPSALLCPAAAALAAAGRSRVEHGRANGSTRIAEIQSLRLGVDPGSPTRRARPARRRQWLRVADRGAGSARRASLGVTAPSEEGLPARTPGPRPRRRPALRRAPGPGGRRGRLASARQPSHFPGPDPAKLRDVASGHSGDAAGMRARTHAHATTPPQSQGPTRTDSDTNPVTANPPPPTHPGAASKAGADCEP